MSRRRETFEVLENQAKMVETEKLFCAGYGGVGSGKTFGAQFKMFKRLRKYPLAGHYVVGADFEQLRGGYFLDFRNILEDLLNWREGRDFKYRENPRPTIILNDTGARIRSLSAELAERIRSTQIQSLHAEEPQTWKNGNGAHIWRTLVGRMRHSVRSGRAYPNMPIQAWLTFNPGGEPGAPVGSWLHKLLTEQWARGDYPSWRFSLRDNYLLQDQAQYIQNIEDNLPPYSWPVEIDGNWPTTGGGVYREFDSDVHTKPPAGMPPLAIDPNKPLLWCLDFNVGLQCSEIAQTHLQPEFTEIIVDPPGTPPRPVKRLSIPGWQRRVFYNIDEIAIPDAGAEDVVNEFLRRYGDHARRTGIYLYGDASGGARSQLLSSQNSVRTNWQAIISGLRNAGIAITPRIQSANPSPGDRVNMVNAQFRTAQGHGTVVDVERCPELVADWRLVAYKPGTNDIDKKNSPPDAARRTHSSDADGYMKWVERTLESNPGAIKWSMVR